LHGKEINLTGDDIIIKSDNFNVDKDGNLICSNATIQGTVNSVNGTIGGWTINNEGLTNGSIFIKSEGFSTVYTVADLIIIRGYLSGYTGFDLSAAMIQHYDFNGDGQVTPADYVILQNRIGISM
jgi:hypothetical protein